MKRVSWIIAVLVMGASTLALARPGKGEARGDGPGFGHGPGGPGFGLCLALKDPDLGVTDEQAARLKPLCKTQREKMGSLGDSLGDLHEAVRTELEKDAPDLDRVGALHQQMATLQTEMARQHVTLRASVREILTAEQITKLKALRDERREGRGRHGKPGAHDGGGCPFGGPDGDEPDQSPRDAD